jgi:predicted O-linked N-acetylglucosamine transferase (SPINDLY family)
MTNQKLSMPPELRLLLACARVLPSQADAAAIRRILNDGPDWDLFVRRAIDLGLTAIAGHTLILVAPDMVPGEIRDSLRASADQARQSNRILCDELAKIIEAFARTGVKAVACQGPFIATQGHGSGLETVEEPHFLLSDPNLAGLTVTLRSLGYERRKYLNPAQLDLIHRLQGYESFFKKGLSTGIKPHTRLTPMNMALDLDYAGLWQRSSFTSLNGKTVWTLSAEDQLIVLAVIGGNELWRRASGVCAFANFIGAHPALSWSAVIERAKLQGCLRMVLLATALARGYFGAIVPQEVIAAEQGDGNISPLVRRIVTRWLFDRPVTRPDTGLSLDRLRLHEGAVRRLRHVMRTLLLPGSHHVARNPFPRLFTSPAAYFVIKTAHDVALFPLVRISRYILAHLRRLRDTFMSYELALLIVPTPKETRLELRRHHKARADAKLALSADPKDAGAWHALGNALHGLKRYEAAIACYDKALEIVPENKAIWSDRTASIRAIRKSGAELLVNEEPALDPKDADSWVRRAGFFLAAQRLGEAAAASDCALAINPRHLAAVRIGIRTRISTCDWRKREDDERRVREGLNAGARNITHYNHRPISDSEAESLTVAKIWAKGILQPQALWRGERYRHDRIRIAYLSGEFNDHATAILIAGVFEHHDRKRFDTTAISFVSKESGMRQRIEAAFDRFVDVQSSSDAKIAAMMHEMEIDIAIDLNGQAGAARPGILAHRPAPAQISYLGNCGTMGVPFLDYIIADHIVISKDQARHYSEKVVYMPNSYQCNDSRRDLPQRTLSRTEAGLPDAGFVFCCFNNNYKIAPPVFDVWMRLLTACPGSVLWLLSDLPDAMRNLRREAAARGVAPERIIFAPRVPVDDHLARHRLADLFLDTLPVNAHATASDALWAGLPVLTCTGNTFAGRVAASLLHAIGLSDLVTSSLAEYEKTALALARDRQQLRNLRDRLARNRQSEPLFDTARYTRDLEWAYTRINEQTERGLPPESFSVTNV